MTNPCRKMRTTGRERCEVCHTCVHRVAMATAPQDALELDQTQVHAHNHKARNTSLCTHIHMHRPRPHTHLETYEQFSARHTQLCVPVQEFCAAGRVRALLRPRIPTLARGTRSHVVSHDATERTVQRRHPTTSRRTMDFGSASALPTSDRVGPGDSSAVVPQSTTSR